MEIDGFLLMGISIRDFKMITTSGQINIKTIILKISICPYFQGAKEFKDHLCFLLGVCLFLFLKLSIQNELNGVAGILTHCRAKTR